LSVERPALRLLPHGVYADGNRGRAPHLHAVLETNSRYCVAAIALVGMGAMKPPISKAIDPKRVGISKSTIVATTLCARKGWYGETIRDTDGRRISVPMPERVLFGTALDEAIQLIIWNAREGVEIDGVIVDEAIQEGLGAMASRPGAEECDPVAIEFELVIAVETFVHEILPTLSLKYLRLQGDDGESLRHGEFIGTPDILILGDEPAIWDVKSSARSKAARDLWSPEMSHYAALYEGIYGSMPLLGYLTWVRTKAPKWQVISMQSTPLHLQLANAHRAATKAVINATAVDALPFNTALCGSCEWKVAHPELGFGGCSIGQAVAVMSGTEEAEGN